MSAVMADAARCFHCGETIPPDITLSSTVFGEEQPMCCHGCKAVADTIVQSGMSDYYRFRTEYSASPPDELLASENKIDHLKALDNPKVQSHWITRQELQCSTSLAIDGMTCAACAWLIEKHLFALPGVEQVQVNASQQRMNVAWNDEKIKLSELVSSVGELGYQAYLYRPAEQEARLKKERTKLLTQLGLAGVGAMQVMMLAIGLYIGGEDIAHEYSQLLRGASLLFATLVVLYSAQPFFKGAWRDITSLHPGMDVPVSLAIGGAYVASIYHTIIGQGEVYFDSVSMFTFFLLIGRYLEMSARHKASLVTGAQMPVVPELAQRLEEGQWVETSLDELNPGDHIRVKHGAMVPVDGVLKSAQSELNEALLTGEFLPVLKQAGAEVSGGSVNAGDTIEIEVTSIGDQMTLGKIQRLVDQAASHKPRLVKLADQVAGHFVLGVLLIAGSTYGVWHFIRPESAFEIALSVLVVTCPCALSLAMPAVITAAFAAASKVGLVARQGEVMETLANVTDVVFDKTGTLTNGQVQIQQTVVLAGEKENALALAAALEHQSDHPISVAFEPFVNAQVQASNVSHVAGKGLKGEIGGVEYRLGVWEFASNQKRPEQFNANDHWVFLADNDQVVAAFELQDSLRADAKRTIESLNNAGYITHLLSGDASSVPANVAKTLGIAHVRSSCTPEDKMTYLADLQSTGKTVMMVGDGVNDAPVLAKADVGMVVANAADISKLNADIMSLSSRIARVITGLQIGKKAKAIIRQNLTWAISYNLLALPVAAAGVVPPWLAAIGMSLSSLVVVINALRVMKVADQ